MMAESLAARTAFDMREAARGVMARRDAVHVMPPSRALNESLARIPRHMPPARADEPG